VCFAYQESHAGRQAMFLSQMTRSDDLTFGRERCRRHEPSYLTSKTDVSPASIGCRMTRVTGCQPTSSRIRAVFFGPMPRICTSVSTFAATTCSTEPSWLPCLLRQGRDTLVILLGGGTKKTQDRDIVTAHERWQDYKKRKSEEK
jgi:hypothetical protein